VALHAALDSLCEIGFEPLAAHDRRLARRLREGLRSTPGVRLLGPGAGVETLPVAAFTLDGVPHALVAARLATEEAIGVRHGCFCAHPYLVRLLGLSGAEVAAYRDEFRRGDRTRMPGAVRASCGINTSKAELERLLAAVAGIASGEQPPVAYHQDPRTGDFFPDPEAAVWPSEPGTRGAACSPG
jgi:selenocysteine lyase/cysteine desulfurase